MGSDTVVSYQTLVVHLNSNMTSTTTYPSYSTLNVSYNNLTATATAPLFNICTFKPPLEQWEIDLSFFLNGVITMLVIALGLVGNTLTVIVLNNKTMRTSTNCFLMALAIWDSMVLIVTFFLISVVEFSDSYFRTVFPYIVAFIYPLGLVAQTITIWLTVSFTVERYIAVCHPLKAAGMCTINRARMVIVCVCFISLLFNMSRWFEYEVGYFSFPLTNDTCNIIKPTEFSQDHMYHKVYFGWAYFLVMCVIPLISLALLNTSLILAVRRSREQRKDMNVRQSRENNVTIMLISVVILFMLFQVPALIYNMAYAIDMNSVTNSFGWKILSTIRNFLVNVNSAVNFILYCALGQKFRRTFVRTFCPKMQKNMDNFNSFSNAYKMEKIRVNGTTKYVKMAGRNHHTTTSTTEDSGVVTKCTPISRYSPHISHSNGSNYTEHTKARKVDIGSKNVDTASKARVENVTKVTDIEKVSSVAKTENGIEKDNAEEKDRNTCSKKIQENLTKTGKELGSDCSNNNVPEGENEFQSDDKLLAESENHVANGKLNHHDNIFQKEYIPNEDCTDDSYLDEDVSTPYVNELAEPLLLLLRDCKESAIL